MEIGIQIWSSRGGEGMKIDDEKKGVKSDEGKGEKVKWGEGKVKNTR